MQIAAYTHHEGGAFSTFIFQESQTLKDYTPPKATQTWGLAYAINLKFLQYIL